MADLVEPSIIRFDDFLLDRRAGQLLRIASDGQKSPVRLGNRAFQILCLLATRQGEVVSQDEIMRSVWANVTVEPNNLTVQLSAVRRALDVDRLEGSCIQNIAGRGYRFVPKVTWESASTSPSNGTNLQPRPSKTILLATVGLCVAVMVALAATFLSRLPLAPVPIAHDTPAAASTERPRLSLIVLPFDNLSRESLNEPTVDHITDDVTTELVRNPGFVVIARKSAFAFKGMSVDIKQIGQQFSIRYAVEGSFRKVEGIPRVNVQLVSTETNEQLWAGRFTAGYDVDDLVRQVATALRFRLIDIEAARSLRERPDNPDAFDLWLQGTYALHNLPRNPESLARAQSLYERSLQLEPASARAMAGVVEALLDSIFAPADDPTVPAKLRRAEELLTRAELLDPGEKHVMLGRVNLLQHQGRCEELIPAARRAIDAHPSLTGTHFFLGVCMILTGKPDEAIPHFEQSIRVNPRSPGIFSRYELIGLSLLYLRRYDDAIVAYRKALATNPNHSPRVLGGVHAGIAAAAALAGRLDEARLSAAEAGRLWPMLTVRGIFSWPIRDPKHAAYVVHTQEGMRLAGVRDHANEDADYGLPPSDALQSNLEGWTPLAAPGARTIRTSDLSTLLEEQRPLVLDTAPWGRSIPGAVALWGAGIGGSISDPYQDRLRQKMLRLTGGKKSMPIVTVSQNAERFQGRNLALRLVALGYTNVYWYRGGREAWAVADMPMAEVVLQEW